MYGGKKSAPNVIEFNMNGRWKGQTGCWNSIVGVQYKRRCLISVLSKNTKYATFGYFSKWSVLWNYRIVIANILEQHNYNKIPEIFHEDIVDRSRN